MIDREAKNCHICKIFSWWLSVHGGLVCGVCHSPAREKLVRRWIGNEKAMVKSCPFNLEPSEKINQHKEESRICQPVR